MYIKKSNYIHLFVAFCAGLSVSLPSDAQSAHFYQQEETLMLKYFPKSVIIVSRDLFPLERTILVASATSPSLHLTYVKPSNYQGDPTSLRATYSISQANHYPEHNRPCSTEEKEIKLSHSRFGQFKICAKSVTHDITDVPKFLGNDGKPIRPVTPAKKSVKLLNGTASLVTPGLPYPLTLRFERSTAENLAKFIRSLTPYDLY